MTPTAALALLAALAVPGAHPLPADPFQRTAYQVVVLGMYDAAPWQLAAYKRGMAQGVTASRVFVTTQYNGNEADGKHDRYGNRCTLRTAASNKLPKRAFIWTDDSGMRQVLDCGSTGNDYFVAHPPKRYRGMWPPETAVWVDVWWRTASEAHRMGFDGWRPRQGAVIAP